MSRASRARIPLQKTARRSSSGSVPALGQCSLPGEAQDNSTALRLVDQRLYAAQAFRMLLRPATSAAQRLLQLIAERLPELSEHLHEVAVMARSTGERTGIAGEDLELMVRAAELHDLGKIAVSDAMLLKPNTLEPRERAIVDLRRKSGSQFDPDVVEVFCARLDALGLGLPTFDPDPISQPA